MQLTSCKNDLDVKMSKFVLVLRAISVKRNYRTVHGCVMDKSTRMVPSNYRNRLVGKDEAAEFISGSV